MENPQPQKTSGLMARFVPLAQLSEYRNNARTHSAEQIQSIVRAVREFGWTAPILADSSGIIAGHGRLQAARLIYASGDSISLPSGQTIPQETVPVLDCSGWSDERRRAYIIADNAIPLGSGWDKALLSAELQDLKLLDVDLTLLGLSSSMVDKLTSPPEPPEVKEWDLGDIYEPFWLVIRGPLSELHKIRSAIQEAASEKVVVDGGGA